MTAAEEQDVRIARFVAGEASPEEAMLLADWTAANPEHTRYLKEALQAFALEPVSVTAAAWKEFEMAVKSQPVKRKQWPLVAASFVLLGLCFGWWFSRPRKIMQQPVIYNSGADFRQVELPDGSHVRLSAYSHLTVVRKRQFRFSGSGQFTIRHQAADPVCIDMGQFFIKDLGTRFSVNTSADQDTINVTVQEGKVLLYDANQVSKMLKAGSKARYIRSVQHLEYYTLIPGSSKRSGAARLKSVAVSPSVKNNDTIVKPITSVPAKTTIIKPVKPDTNRIKPIYK